MKFKKGVTFIIPCYNESNRISLTINTLLKISNNVKGLKINIVAVNDGSTDSTGKLLEYYQKKIKYFRVVTHKNNMGLGLSIQSALTFVCMDKFMVVPGDNDLPYSTILNLICLRNKADLISCFFVDRENRGIIRGFLSSIFCLIYASFFDVPLQYINGPCMYSTKAAKNISLKSERFSIIAELNTKILKKGATFAEVISCRQTGSIGSSALRLSSLFEALKTFIVLLFEIHLLNKKRFSKKPVRIILQPIYEN